MEIEIGKKYIYNSSGHWKAMIGETVVVEKALSLEDIESRGDYSSEKDYLKEVENFKNKYGNHDIYYRFYIFPYKDGGTRFIANSKNFTSR